jgi:hypothetical protein
MITFPMSTLPPCSIRMALQAGFASRCWELGVDRAVRLVARHATFTHGLVLETKGVSAR